MISKQCCDSCGGFIEFETDELDGESMSILCPHCSAETRLERPGRVEVVRSEVPPLLPAGFSKRTGEQTFYSDGMVEVTRTRFQIGTQLYAVSGITSVREETREQGKSGEAILTVFGSILAICSMGSFTSDQIAGGVIMVLIGGAMMIAGIVLMCIKKPIHYVMIGTAGGEVQAYGSTDRLYAARIHSALTMAIVSRG